MQDVLHFSGLEEPSAHNSRPVCGGRRPVGPGGIRCRIQAGSMGAIPPHRGHERDPAEHPSETGSAAGPRAHQGKPPGRWSISGDRGLRNGGVSVRRLHRIIICRVIKMESGIAAALTRDGGKDDSTIRLG